MMRAKFDRQKKKNAEKAGRRAEWVAAFFLALKGYWPLAWRAKTRLGEIDLIVQSFVPWREKTIVAVEVKYRQTTHLGLESITPKQKSRINNGLQLWLQAKGYTPDKTSVRMDAVVVSPKHLPYHVINISL